MKYKKDLTNLYKRNGVFCFRKIWKDENGIRKDYRKSLDVNQLPLARKRRDEILSRFDEIMLGVELSYSWEGDANRTTIKEKRLDEVVERYIKHKEAEKLAKSSIKRIGNSLDNLVGFLGSGFNYNGLTLDNIDDFKKSISYKTPRGLNIDVRNVRAFCNWLFHTGRINRQLPIKQVKEPEQEPQYLSQDEIAKLMSLDSLSERMKRIIRFYIATGQRIASVFFGHLKTIIDDDGKILDDKYLIIPADAPHNKSKREIEVLIDYQCQEVWNELIEMKKEWEEQGYMFSSLTLKICKEFKRAVKESGIRPNHHFHNLRHTFAVIELITTGNVYKVKEQMGHSSITVTEMYAKIKARKLKADFPSLVSHIPEVPKRLNFIESGHQSGVTKD